MGFHHVSRMISKIRSRMIAFLPDSNAQMYFWSVSSL